MKEILIINRNPSANSRIKSRLEKEGYSVETAEGGKNGISKARQKQYSAILIDYFLPETSGPEICYMLKHGTRTKNSKIYFLSEKNREESNPVKLEVCSDGYISTQDSLDDIFVSIKTRLGA